MNRLLCILSIVVLASCAPSMDVALNSTYEDPYQEINAYFEEMGLTPKGEPARELKTSKREIMSGLQEIYARWNYYPEMDVDKFLPEMTVCQPDSQSEENCKTWVW